MFLLENLGISSRPATLLRIVGLAGFVYWQAATVHPAGFHGRHLVLTLLLCGAGLAWIVWSWTFGDSFSTDRGLSWDLFLMAVCGGLMVGISPEGPSNVFIFVAAFSAGARTGIPRALLVALAAVVALSISWIVYDVGGLGVLAYALGLVATTFGGSQRHDSLLRREQAELLLVQTQRSHEEALRNAKLEESSRIAREIHDVLAHSLAGLTIQLEATAALIEGGADPDTILPRVRHAHELAREGLRETRLAVGALRGEGSLVVPAAFRIESLISDFRATGNEVELVMRGERERLAGPAADAAVRIVQEALTNVTKHAPRTNVRIEIDAGPPLTATIANQAPAGVTLTRSSLSSSGGGYGIAGMRERAEELGGTLTAGPTAEGWKVHVELPGGGS